MGCEDDTLSRVAGHSQNRSFQALDMNENFAEHAREREIEGSANGIEELGGCFLLSTLDLGEISQGDSGRFGDIAQGAPLIHARGTQRGADGGSEKCHEARIRAKVASALSIVNILISWRVPDKFNCTVVVPEALAMATQTVPAFWPYARPGPATPVVEIAKSLLNCERTDSAMEMATVSETAVCLVRMRFGMARKVVLERSE
jgi:hypothetical protein